MSERVEQVYFVSNLVPVSVRLAQVLGLTSTAFFAGKTFSQSFSTTPALLLAPAPLLAQQWKKMFDSDKYLAPGVVLFSGSVFAYLASRERLWTRERNLFTTAAVLLAAAVPYSYFIGEPINQKLEAKASSFASATLSENEKSEVGIRQEETVHYLVDRWAMMNLGRTALTGVASLLAMWASIESVKIHAVQILSAGEKS